MITCDNCGKTNCDCDRYKDEIQQLKSKFAPMSHEELIRRAKETVRRWEEKELASDGSKK